MSLIAFIDIEVNPQNQIILDIGGIKSDESIFHNKSIPDFIHFLKGANYFCGHNIIQHDLKYLGPELTKAGYDLTNTIDTLYLSPLFFPTRPYHALIKDDKLQTEELSNPLNDVKKTYELFLDTVQAFNQCDEELKQIFYQLLRQQKEFCAFFNYLNYSSKGIETATLIQHYFSDKICNNLDLSPIISDYPIELAYCLSLINSLVKHQKSYSITPPWVLSNYPLVERLMRRLRNLPCQSGCHYCNYSLGAHEGLKRFFGLESFRLYDNKPLQEQAVKAAIANQSLLAVFPTGGGKSITFQLPALMSGENVNGLTVVISPLQSLMKDQVDNLEQRGITRAVTINGLLDPIERAKALERVEDGSATLLYLSPESLRSNTIERLLLKRKIVRFVIDEAHCFSVWGQDFRTDYLYIGDFIQTIQAKKQAKYQIPVSCFTATAKQKVIEDICQYFKVKLQLNLQVFSASTSRKNLTYQVIHKANEKEKYLSLRDLIESRNCPTIVYVSRTKRTTQLAERLTQDGLLAKPYHGKMEAKDKTAIQNAFIAGDIPIIVATSAFGMGVDKKDVGLVVHFEISDSLENYIQEAGRAGRDNNIQAECFVLYDEADLNKHFILLNQTKLTIKEIHQIWKAIKKITRFRSEVSNSALEIARLAGWDDTVVDIETRVVSAIAALEDTGYLKRGQNMPRIFANSILAKNVQEAAIKINTSVNFTEDQKVKAIRIIKKLFSSKDKKRPGADDTGESRVDYISDHLGIVKEEVINILNLLREEKILADAKDLTAFIKKGENQNRSMGILETYSKAEQVLINLFKEEECTYHLKELNETCETKGCTNINLNIIKILLNYWGIKNYLRYRYSTQNKNYLKLQLLDQKELLLEKIHKRQRLSKFIVRYLYSKVDNNKTANDLEKEEAFVEYSVLELKEEFEKTPDLFKTTATIDEVEETLFFLTKIGALKIEGGFMVLYNKLTIKRLQQDNKKRYKVEDYQKLQQYYQNKIQQIHIVGEYAKKMSEDYKEALQFVDDYFQLKPEQFLNKYFKGVRRDEISRNITPSQFKKLFGELSPTQLKIINDKDSKHIVVAAGPGSGKTRILVHKLASLFYMEDVKHEQMLMLTFSRSAATEFKYRLLKLIGNAAHFVEIKTFHSYCFDLLGKIGNLESSENVLCTAAEKIRANEVDPSRITKTVLVIDEAQDMGDDEMNLLNALIEQNEEMRVIAVGDDDQSIYEFKGGNAKHLEHFIQSNNAKKYELIENYRSKSNLVHFSNQYLHQLTNRLKSSTIIPVQSDNGIIKLTRYQSSALIEPLVDSICQTNLSGSTCVLSKTNNEALQIAGLLVKKGVQTKFIQSNDSFNLYQLVEIRYFLEQLHLSDDIIIIDDNRWERAKQALQNQYGTSSILENCFNLFNNFECSVNKKFKSDLYTFIKESKLEDLYSNSNEIVFVSTMHKAKGKEFDNIFLLLDNYQASSAEQKRVLYVGMTRAKNNLYIHSNNNLLDYIRTEDLQLVYDDKTYQDPNQVVLQLSYRDVWLSYFTNKQKLITPLRAGDSLKFNQTECLTKTGHSVLKFSKQFSTNIAQLAANGYSLFDAKVNFMTYWKNEDQAEEIIIILPELHFRRSV